MTNIILSVDVASLKPSFCLATEDSDNNINILEIFDLEQARDAQGRYEVAMYSNCLDNILDKHNLKLSNINKLIYINGPGPFSSLRWVTVLAKLLFRLNTNISVFSLSQNYAYYRYYLSQELINSQDNIYVAVKAGIRGYFVEKYNNKSILNSAKLTNLQEYKELITQEKNIIEINENNKIISEILISSELLNIQENKITSLEEIIPNYLRDANITMPKSK